MTIENASLFDDYTVNIIIGDGVWEWAGGNGTTRAVVTLSDDISYAMPVFERLIESCVYNDITFVAAFRYKNFGVIIHRYEVMITNAGDHSLAVEVLDFLKDVIENADRITQTIKTY